MQPQIIQLQTLCEKSAASVGDNENNRGCASYELLKYYLNGLFYIKF
jgi:hypothetical protein